MQQASKTSNLVSGDVSGEFTEIDGERYYAIRNVDKMAPFFISVISNNDHWLFVSSAGGLTLPFIIHAKMEVAPKLSGIGCTLGFCCDDYAYALRILPSI